MSNELKPILVPGPEARRLLGIRETKYHDLLKRGALESVFLGKRRMIVLASIERLAAPQSDAR